MITHLMFKFFYSNVFNRFEYCLYDCYVRAVFLFISLREMPFLRFDSFKRGVSANFLCDVVIFSFANGSVEGMI